MADKKNFNLTVARMYTTKSGNARSLRIQDDELEALQHIEKGGMLLVKYVPEDRRKNDKSPHAYLEYVKPEDVDAFFSNTDAPKAGSPRQSRPKPMTEDSDSI